MRTPEFGDKDFHHQHLGSKTRVLGVMGQGSHTERTSVRAVLRQQVGTTSSLKSRKLRLAKMLHILCYITLNKPCFPQLQNKELAN